MTPNIVLESFLLELSSEKKLKAYLKKATQQYDILKYRIMNFSALDIKKMYYKIIQKYQPDKPLNQNQGQEHDENTWLINELKVFVWLTVCYSFHNNLSLGCLDKTAWNFLVSVFYFKNVDILQYQLLSLLKTQNKKSTKWTTFEEDLLVSIMQDHSLQGKWNEISKIFFLKSQKKRFRKPQKCRQHWFNHLNPIISHSVWSVQEDILLFENVRKIGKKWSDISKTLGGRRTQHMVKNRYMALAKKIQNQISAQENKCQKSKTLQIQTLTQKENSSTDLVFKWQDLNDFYKTQVRIEKQLEFPVNIQTRSIEQQQNLEDGPCQNIQEELQQCKLIQICEENFFVKSKKSIGLFSDMGEDVQKYVESFLF